MKKLVIAIIILVFAAFISYNYNSITGKTTVLDQIRGTVAYAETQIKIDPIEAKAGQTISVTVIPGSDGAKKEMLILSKSGLVKDSTKEWCNLGYTRTQQLAGGVMSYKCTQTKTFNYRIPASFKTGDYYIRLYDYAKAKTNKCYNVYGSQKEDCLSTIAWFTVIA